MMINIPINYNVIVPQSALNKIREHAREAAPFYIRHGRGISQVERDITMGKIGEEAIYKICKEHGLRVSDVNYQISNNYDDGGYDLIVEDLKVDVKTIGLEKMGRFRQLIMNSRNLRADVYALCWVDEATGDASYGGAITKDKIDKEQLLRRGLNSQTGHQYYYVDISELSK